MADVEMVHTTQPAVLESPFAEASAFAPVDAGEAFSWNEALSPFADPEAGDFFGEGDALLREVLGELRDEGFHEAITQLSEEIETAVADRFMGETDTSGPSQERFADNYLSSVRFAAEQYLTNLDSELSNLDFASLDANGLDATLDSFDPPAGDLTPAGEEFLGKLVKKAKSAVRFVANKAKQVGKLALPLLTPFLKQLRRLVNPLLKRVLSLAIGRLPAPLQPAARTLAAKFIGETQDDGEDQEMSPANPVDSEVLADSFDYRLAEALAYPERLAELDNEAFAAGADEIFEESHELAYLAEARGALIDSLSEAHPEAIEPAVEQFVPAVLAALRTGIKLVGRPRVVGFIAKYLAGLIRPYVEKDQAAPLARAIADTGLRLATLEAETDTAETAQVALASVIEDTVRRFAENDDYVMESDELGQGARAEAFGEAVATHFPDFEVREDLRLAPSLAGTFITRSPRALRSYAKYSRTPEIEISSRLADTLPGFGGTTLGAATREAGGRFPMRARMHIYQIRPGTTLGAIARHDRRHGAIQNAYPLTHNAAGMLLREPALGTRVPKKFMRNHGRLAAGQRVYVLEPIGGAGAGHPGAPKMDAARVWLSVNPTKARLSVGFYLSEPQAQQVAAALRAGRGAAPLLSRLYTALKPAIKPQSEGEAVGFEPPLGEDGEGFDDFAAKRGLERSMKRQLRKQVAAWALTAASEWLRNNAEAFIRAAAHPDPGVTLRVRLNDVPGLAKLDVSTAQALLRSKPAAAISVSPGHRK